jgi:hypothetical protein
MTRKLSLILILVIFSCLLTAERFYHEEIIKSTLNTTDYQLSHTKLVSGSESVQIGEKLLIRGKDYQLNYKSGILSFPEGAPAAVFSISYLIIPPEIAASKQIYSRSSLSDSLATRHPAIPSFRPAANSRLNVTGSKTFALSLSESGDTDLLQSLYVNLDGELSSNIFINAQLSDSQSKLSPEGDSKELSSLDQVFIRVYGKSWELGMGDLDLSFKRSPYLNFYNKIEGIVFRYDKEHEASAAYSAGGGKRASSKITIIDGKQGPYYLTPDDSQRSFIIIAGTEEIHMDGVLLERGRDYTIDYSEGSVMFRSIVSSLSSVIAWFQYSDENYRQNSIFSSSNIKLNDKFSFFHHLVHQEDLRNHPLLFSFTQADKDSLYNAGDGSVFTDGIALTDSGAGYYKKISDDLGNEYYEYAPGQPDADYNIVFSYLGPTLGDYEEYSSGKYRFVGAGLGSYMPLKRLIAPTKRSNLEFGFVHNTEKWNNHLELLYSHYDKNTFSPLSDSDNSGGIVSLGINRQNSPLKLGIDAQYRLPHTALPAESESISQDLAALETPENLGMQTLDLNLGYNGDAWRPSLFLRLRNLEEQYAQKALRLSSISKAKSVLPALNFAGTVSSQEGNKESFLQYYDLTADWSIRLINLRLNGIFSDMDQDNLGTRSIKLKPTIEIKNESSFSALSFTKDELQYKLSEWQKASEQETYSIQHNSSFGAQHLNLEFSHRTLHNANQDEGAGKNAYQLFTMNNSNSILKGALSLFGNYQLNQTEFFPRYRELVYVGSGFGVLDSLGVEVENGEYNYEYVTSPTGTLSSELTALVSIYFKPGQYLSAPIWKRINSDISITASEQNEDLKDWQSYLFIPSYVFNNNTIYGRQSVLQNIYFDLYQGKIISNLSLEQSKDIDQRYQSPEKTSEQNQALQLDFRGYLGLNTRLNIINSQSRESRYNSHVKAQSFAANMEKVLDARSTAVLNLKASQEKGKDQSGSGEYSLKTITFSPSLRSVLMQKYRITASLGAGYNDRKGSDYLSFLPEKRQGFFVDGNISTNYRINDYSSLSLEYKASKYPKNKASHNLKLEFRAEL